MSTMKKGRLSFGGYNTLWRESCGPSVTFLASIVAGNKCAFRYALRWMSTTGKGFAVYALRAASCLDCATADCGRR